MTARQKIRGKYDSCVACYFATDGKRKTRKGERKGWESGEKGTYEAYIGEGRPKTGMYRAVNRIEEMKRDGERRGKEETVDNEGLSCLSSDVYPFAPFLSDESDAFLRVYGTASHDRAFAHAFGCGRYRDCS